MLHRVCRHLWLQGREYQSLGLARRQGRLNLVNLLVVGGLARRALQLHFTAKVGRGLLDPGRDALPVFRIERLEDDRNRVRLLTACGRLRAVGGTAACGQGNCHRARQEHRHPSLCIHAVLSSVHGVCARRAVCAAPISGHFSARFFSALSGFYYIFWLSGYQFAEYINQTFGQNRPFPALFFGRIDGRPRPHVPPFPPRLPSIYFCSAGVRARFGHIEQRPGWPRRADMFRGPMSACRCPGFCGMMLSENKTQTFVRHAQDHNLRKQRGGERQRGARKRRGGGAYGALCI